jgi:DNA-binding CsgD family transcriptional regulator
MSVGLVLVPRSGLPSFFPTFRLRQGRCVIGRSLECELLLQDSSVSRVHAEITVIDERVTVSDLHSRNGTYIDDDMLCSQPTSLQLGRCVRFGEVSFRLTTGARQDDEPELETPLVPGFENGRAVSAKLTRAQGRVLEELMQGFTERRIARHLNLSQETVHCHIRAIFRFFAVHSRAELMALFLRLAATRTNSHPTTTPEEGV